MSPKKQTVVVEQWVKAAPAQVYYAFTNATALREWLCDVATVLPRPGGRMYLWWEGDFFSSGSYVSLTPNQALTFIWAGRSNPGPTQVTVTLTEQDGGALVRLSQEVPLGKKWEGQAEMYQGHWRGSLLNLASVLETGLDRRITQRPMLGIMVGEFNSQVAARLGVPVTQGIRLDGTMEGLGAHAAGLQQNDVIVAVDGKTITSDFASLHSAIQGKQVGDVVEVAFYRGAEQKTVAMRLGGRPIPNISFDPTVFVETLRPRYAEDLAALQACFAGVAESEASFIPAPGEWSAKQIMAHLILGERGFTAYVSDVIGGHERWADDYGGNVLAQIQALLSVYPTLPELLDQFQKAQAEALAFISLWPPEFAARKGSYWRMAYGLMLGETHTHAHLEQIRAAIAAAIAANKNP